MSSGVTGLYQRPNSRLDHGLIATLLQLAMKLVCVHIPIGNIDMNSQCFLDLIQLFIDLLRDDSILTTLEKVKLQ